MHPVQERAFREDSEKRQLMVVKTIGGRLREARELCDLPQIEAARRLGCSKQWLNKLETASNINQIPLWLIDRAARIYDVSFDYLFGVSDDWELSARACMERSVSQWLFDEIERMRLEDMDILKHLHDDIHATDEFISETLEASSQIVTSLEAFRNRNADFDEMRGGSKLVASVARLRESCRTASIKMTLFKESCGASRFEKVLTSIKSARKDSHEPEELNNGG